MKTVLIAEDEPEVRNYLGFALTCEGYRVEFAEDGGEVVRFLERNRNGISVLLLDLIMPRKDGFTTLKEVRQAWPALPVITISGMCTPANIASVMKDGAVDFLPKPVGHRELLRAVQAALDLSCTDRLPEASERNALAATSHLRASCGTWSQGVEPLLGRLGNSDVPVLLRGETGVGKEVLARKLHEHSKRAGQPFLKLNCAALPTELVESELFGYERGAFTGAFKNTPGKFEMANNGTILLDEIGDMDFKLQAKLLQVLQDQEFLRLGAKNISRVNVRVMAATHCDLERAMHDSRFREDLYYRLNIVEIHVPPLRERREEIISLAEFFLQKHSPADSMELPPRLCKALLEHDWPGNIRELENIIRRFLVFRNADLIAAELKRKTRTTILVASPGLQTLSAERLRSGLTGPPETVHFAAPDIRNESRSHARSAGSALATDPGTLQGARAQHSAPNLTSSSVPGAQDPSGHSSILTEVDEARKTAEARAILSALNSTLWNRKQAAKLLKVDYKALLYKMKKLKTREKETATQSDTTSKSHPS
jgi:two-component system, NtrC family, response regulator AtoC